MANILKGISAIIFDLDGLLLDSETSWWKANEQLLGKRGQKYTFELSKKVIGAGHKETMKLYKDLFGLTEEIDELATERKELMYQHLMENISFLDGSAELINELAKRQYSLAIATGGHSVERVNELLKYIEADDKFRYIVSSEGLKRGKPFPDIYFYTAKKLNVEPSKCLVLEDAAQGVVAGVAAGMKVIGINKDKKKQKALKKAGAFVVAHNLKEVLNMIE